MFRVFLIIALSWAANGQKYEIKPLTISRLSPSGLRMTLPHEPGMGYVAIHYSINKRVPGVTSGDWNIDIISPKDDEWVHENTEVDLKSGDSVYLWHLVVHHGVAHQLLDQAWTYAETTMVPPTDAPTSPITTITTQKPVDPPTPPVLIGNKKDPKRKVFNAFKNRDELKKKERAGESCTSYPCLILEDNFDTLDFDTWEHEITAGGGGNWEFQYYTNNRSNTYVRDGTLYIKPTLTSEKFGEAFLNSGTLDLWGHQPATVCTGNQWYGCMRVGNVNNYINPIQSARLRSSKSFNFRYGKVEIEARLPKGDWIWPALWLLPRHDSYGGWPASGEIDIVESRGNLNLRNEEGRLMGHQHAGATLHWGPFAPYNGYQLTSGDRNGDWADSFHKYTLEWDDSSLKVFYDDDLVLNVEPPAGGFWDIANWPLPADRNPWKDSSKMAPFDQEFYIIMNVAVGGTNGFFPDSWTNGAAPKPWSNTSPTGPRDFWFGRNGWLPTWNGEDAAMAVNYVKVWKMKAD